MASATKARILPGMVIALLGVLLLLHNFDIVNIGRASRLWPLLVVALGLHWAIEGKNRILGVVVALAGVALQLDLLGWIDVSWRDMWRFWPVLLIAAGVGMMVQRRDNLLGGVALTCVGAFFLADNFRLIRFDLWQLWPIAVILLGIAMIRKAI